MTASNNHPFLQPLWRRVALVAFCFVWAAVELWHGEQMWALISAGLGAYGAWIFLINYKPDPAQE